MTDEDCEPGFACVFTNDGDPNQPPAGTCSPNEPEPVACFSDLDCAPDEMCDFTDQNEPPNGLVPLAGVCKPKKEDPAPCKSDAECGLGEECSAAEPGAPMPPPPQIPEMLCADTGGKWTECGSGCGPATCAKPDPGLLCPSVCTVMCECPQVAPLWDEVAGCIPKDACGEVGVQLGVCVPIACADDLDCPPETTCQASPDDNGNGDPLPSDTPGTCQPSDEKACIVSGCSSEICADVAVNTLCVFEPWYECLQWTQCGNFAPDGGCSWEPNEVFNECVKTLCGGDPNCGPGQP